MRWTKEAWTYFGTQNPRDKACCASRRQSEGEGHQVLPCILVEPPVGRLDLTLRAFSALSTKQGVTFLSLQVIEQINEMALSFCQAMAAR